MEKIKIHQPPDGILIYLNSDFLSKHKLFILCCDKETDSTYAYNTTNGPVKQSLVYYTGRYNLIDRPWLDSAPNSYAIINFVYDPCYHDKLEQADKNYYLAYPVEFPLNNYIKYKKVQFGDVKIPIQMMLLTDEVFDEPV